MTPAVMTRRLRSACAPCSIAATVETYRLRLGYRGWQADGGAVGRGGEREWPHLAVATSLLNRRCLVLDVCPVVRGDRCQEPAGVAGAAATVAGAAAAVRLGWGWAPATACS